LGEWFWGGYVDKKVASGFAEEAKYKVLITIHGKSGVYIERLSKLGAEKEILLNVERFFRYKVKRFPKQATAVE
jgi:hypothetical protein